MNSLPGNLFFDVALQDIFIVFKFDKDTHSQCECPLSNQSQKWRNVFNLPNFKYNNHLITPQGLIDHATIFGKKAYIYHVTTYY